MQKRIMSPSFSSRQRDTPTVLHGAGRDDKDHIFFADMLALFKDKLSIDTSRIFCCGFSFGAMVSYSLSLDFQDELRAVACYAPANWNIYLPENKHKPIAFYSTTGTQDDLCKWINSDARKQGGKYCVITHLEDNGLKEIPEIPLATSPHTCHHRVQRASGRISSDIRLIRGRPFK